MRQLPAAAGDALDAAPEQRVHDRRVGRQHRQERLTARPGRGLLCACDGVLLERVFF